MFLHGVGGGNRREREFKRGATEENGQLVVHLTAYQTFSRAERVLDIDFNITRRRANPTTLLE